nr:signal peptidase II [Pseudaminobacter soli]
MFSGVFRERPVLLAAIAVAISTGLIVWAMHAERRAEASGLGLIASGAMGNVVDRVRQGAVTDFLDFHLGDWHWPAFNFADVMISIRRHPPDRGHLLPGKAGRHHRAFSREGALTMRPAGAEAGGC